MKGVKGLNKLTPEQKESFFSTHKRHVSGVGNEYKEGWTPISVKPLGKNLKVVFKNGEWLHYTPDGNWY